MLNNKFFFIFYLFFSLIFSQQDRTLIKSYSSQSSEWNAYFSYNLISDIENDGHIIYFASYNSVFSYNIYSQEIEKYDTLKGLSGDEISAFYHSSEKNIISIGYKNGFLQIIDLNANSIINIYDIINKPTISPNIKEINHFYEIDEELIISTGYGISVYNLSTFEFGDTYYIGDFASFLNISSTISDENYLYASSPELGIFRCNLSSNLIDFNNWENIYFGNVNELLSNESNILFYDNNNIKMIQNDNIISLLSLGNQINSINFYDSKFTITSESNCLVFNNQLNQLLDTFNSNDYLASFNNGITIDNKTLIGTKEKGVIIIQNSGQSHLYLIPDGPIENNVFTVETLNNFTWISYGDYTEYFNPHPLKSSGLSSFNESTNSWYNINKDSIPSEAVNLNNIAINPFDNNNVFVSSFHGGLLELNNLSVFEFYNNENSGLESLSIGNSNYNSVRISDIEFDQDGILWLLNSRIDSPLKSFNLTTNNWSSFDFTDIIDDGLNDELGFNDIEIDSEGNKWIAGLNSGLIGFNENFGSPLIRKIFNQDQSNMPSPYVKSIAIDKNNHLWIGTIKGLRVLYNTTGFFDSPSISTQQIIIIEDGIPRELLEQQYITDIEVDGGNNKWVGTIGSGVFYFSSNGQQTIYHFTKENSPLPSNNINDIGINSFNGKVYFATDQGLVSFKTGSSLTSDSFSTSFVYPNPVRPSFDSESKKIKISGLTQNVNIKITDIEGNLVAEAQSNINNRYNNFNLEIDGGKAFWNGRNLSNRPVSSGVYIIMLSDLDSYETKILKLMIIR